MPKYKPIGQGQGWTVIQADVPDYLAASLWLRQYYGEYFHINRPFVNSKRAFHSSILFTM